jgi:hypothetical protein
LGNASWPGENRNGKLVVAHFLDPEGNVTGLAWVGDLFDRARARRSLQRWPDVTAFWTRTLSMWLRLLHRIAGVLRPTITAARRLL